MDVRNQLILALTTQRDVDLESEYASQALEFIRHDADELHVLRHEDLHDGYVEPPGHRVAVFVQDDGKLITVQEGRFMIAQEGEWPEDDAVIDRFLQPLAYGNLETGEIVFDEALAEQFALLDKDKIEGELRAYVRQCLYTVLPPKKPPVTVPLRSLQPVACVRYGDVLLRLSECLMPQTFQGEFTRLTGIKLRLGGAHFEWVRHLERTLPKLPTEAIDPEPLPEDPTIFDALSACWQERRHMLWIGDEPLTIQDRDARFQEKFRRIVETATGKTFEPVPADEWNRAVEDVFREAS